MISLYYNFLMEEISDPRVKGWVMMDSLGYPLAICGIYLSLVYIFVPAFMRNRKAYNLQTFIKFYNLFQIVCCAFLIWGLLTSGWATDYTVLTCQPVDYSNRPMALRMLNFVYFTLYLKMVELVETVMFLLRKKDSQVTKLHVYHHTSTFLLAWMGVKYIGGGMATFPILINSFIHILMYTYYLLASLGPEWQEKIKPWKVRLTMLQMVQFIVLISQALTIMMPSCTIHPAPMIIYVPNVILVLYMFYEFFQKTYVTKRLKAQ